MALINLFLKDKQKDSSEHFATLEAAFLPSKDDEIWVRCLSLKDCGALEFSSFRVIGIEHCACATERKQLNGKSDEKRLNYKHVVVSYNVIVEGWKKMATIKIHQSHKMTKWESTIVTLIATSRFGRIRKCKKCGAEHAKTVAGEAINEELHVKCQGE